MDKIDARRLIDPACYAEYGYPFEEWRALRREAPVSKIEAPGWPAYWAITKHADIVEVSKQPDAFLNGPGMTMVRAKEHEESSAPPIKTIINMDPPDHKKFRQIASLVCFSHGHDAGNHRKAQGSNGKHHVAMCVSKEKVR